jgi:hypothetical protein
MLLKVMARMLLPLLVSVPDVLLREPRECHQDLQSPAPPSRLAALSR